MLSACSFYGFNYKPFLSLPAAVEAIILISHVCKLKTNKNSHKFFILNKLLLDSFSVLFYFFFKRHRLSPFFSRDTAIYFTQNYFYLILFIHNNIRNWTFFVETLQREGDIITINNILLQSLSSMMIYFLLLNYLFIPSLIHEMRWERKFLKRLI